MPHCRRGLIAVVWVSIHNSSPPHQDHALLSLRSCFIGSWLGLTVCLFCSVVSIHAPRCHALEPRFPAHKKAEQIKERNEQDVVSLHENSHTLLTWRKVQRGEKRNHSERGVRCTRRKMRRTRRYACTLMLLLRFWSYAFSGWEMI